MRPIECASAQGTRHSISKDGIVFALSGRQALAAFEPGAEPVDQAWRGLLRQVAAGRGWQCRLFAPPVIRANGRSGLRCEAFRAAQSL